VSSSSPFVQPPGHGDPTVDICDLRKEFVRRDKRRSGRFVRRQRRVAALSGITLRVERRECVAILGPNGSGKSTLVRLLSTLLLHDGGRAAIFGFDVFAEPRRVRQLVNRVSVEASFFEKLSAGENLSYSAKFYGIGARESSRRIPEILHLVGFPDRGSEPMEDLSRGMQQKVALARALLTAPVLILLDEPTTGLDPRSKLEVQEFVRVLREHHDTTILLCTHDMAEAEALADRIGILDHGRLVALDTPDTLKASFAAETLEQAFFNATGRSLEDDEEVEAV
jgi:ABC-2 type transport system ATP-binding protein